MNFASSTFVYPASPHGRSAAAGAGATQPPDRSATARAWAVRISREHSKVIVRELAGLDDATLASLQAETTARPTLKSPWWVQVTFAIGIAALVLGGAGLGGGAFVPELKERAILWLSIGVMGTGMALSALCWFHNLRLSPVSQGWEQLARYVATLDERHPWLYEAFELVQGNVSEQYRLSVLTHRGSLRGLDVAMMELAIAAQSEVLRCRPAREAAHRLQSIPVAPGIVRERREAVVLPSGGSRPADVVSEVEGRPSELRD